MKKVIRGHGTDILSDILSELVDCAKDFTACDDEDKRKCRDGVDYSCDICRPVEITVEVRRPKGAKQ